jgi:hypothetical protein
MHAQNLRASCNKQSPESHSGSDTTRLEGIFDYFCSRTLTPFLFDNTMSGLPSAFMS